MKQGAYRAEFVNGLFLAKIKTPQTKKRVP